MQNQAEYLLVISSCSNESEAQLLANKIVDENLAACVNIIPQITSIYVWQGKKEQSGESLLLVKTVQEKFSSLRDFIVREHPYELPEVIAVPINDGFPDYLEWIKSSLN